MTTNQAGTLSPKELINRPVYVLKDWIDLINKSLNVNIDNSSNNNFVVSSKLRKFLNDNDFAKNEGISVVQKTIEAFINRLTTNDNSSFLSNSKMSNPKIPTWIDGLEELNDMRNKSYSTLGDKGYKKKNLNDAIAEMTQYREKMAALQPKKRGKKNKYGLLGMDELVKIVANLRQDIKQIKDTQSFMSANDWIIRHGYKDLYEVIGKDLDGDGKPEIVVQTKDDHKPVIVNGYTTIPSLFPYRNYYYHAFPTPDKRKKAHEDGINYRSLVNTIYQPAYYPTGRKISHYDGKDWEKFEKDILAAGVDEKQLIKPKDRSTYQAFVKFCISPIYEAVKYLNFTKLPFTLTQMASVIWNQFALIPAMCYVYGDDVLNTVSYDQWKVLRGKKPVKAAIDEIVYDYLSSPIKIGDFVPTVCEMCNKSGMPVQQSHIPRVAKATIAIILGAKNHLPEDRKQFDVWYNQNILPQVEQIAAENQPQLENQGPSVEEVGEGDDDEADFMDN